MSTLKDAAARASEIVEQLLFAAALDVDRAERVPEAHFAALANAGLYGLAAPTAQQPEVPPSALTDVAEALASGCLATAFVWVQCCAACALTA
jgi:alkylation response protein AidB-like acyl-CoA dehydrogenase